MFRTDCQLTCWNQNCDINGKNGFSRHGLEIYTAAYSLEKLRWLTAAASGSIASKLAFHPRVTWKASIQYWSQSLGATLPFSTGRQFHHYQRQLYQNPQPHAWREQGMRDVSHVTPDYHMAPIFPPAPAVTSVDWNDVNPSCCYCAPAAAVCRRLYRRTRGPSSG